MRTPVRLLIATVDQTDLMKRGDECPWGILVSLGATAVIRASRARSYLFVPAHGIMIELEKGEVRPFSRRVLRVARRLGAYVADLPSAAARPQPPEAPGRLAASRGARGASGPWAGAPTLG